MSADSLAQFKQETEAIVTGRSRYSAAAAEAVNRQYASALTDFSPKIVVLDDDPTGVQTVHGVSVYTDWSEESIRGGLGEDKRIFYILTNSRAFQADETAAVHQQIAERLARVSRELGIEYILVSRSDSTLRGHFPLETETLRHVIEQESQIIFSGEIIVPFFPEGGRYTINDTHFVREGSRFIPAGETEFARDLSFAYESSHLGQYCEEKSKGLYRADQMIYISLASLRSRDIGRISAQLAAAEHFNKIIVNAAEYTDLKVFFLALQQAIGMGRHFLFRSAAALPKILGGIADQPLLQQADLLKDASSRAGLVLIGSHVNKTTRQLEVLRESSKPLTLIAFDQHLVIAPGGLAAETKRVCEAAEQSIRDGRTAVVFTRRERFELDSDDRDLQLKVSVQISQAIADLVAGMKVRPAFILTKGGITSSDVGTKALQVRRAQVLGQVIPGVPVWLTGAESKFPGLPLIIFPGNVGETDALRDVVEMLIQES